MAKEKEICVFCEKIKDEDYLESNGTSVVFEPLNPVVPGHLLVCPMIHTNDFTQNPGVSADAMYYASVIANSRGGDYNLITSKGKSATQSINHLHIHIVPRRKDDGLLLPWSKSQAVHESLHSAIKEIEELRDSVHQEQGSYKYDDCYDDCIAILEKLKEGR